MGGHWLASGKQNAHLASLQSGQGIDLRSIRLRHSVCIALPQQMRCTQGSPGVSSHEARHMEHCQSPWGVLASMSPIRMSTVRHKMACLRLRYSAVDLEPMKVQVNATISPLMAIRAVRRSPL